MSSFKSPATLLALLGLIAVFGCAGAGPDLNGPEGPSFIEAYSGDWTLDRSRSEDLDRKLSESMRGGGGGPGFGGRGGSPPGGGRGGMPGGGMRGGPPGGGRGGMPGGQGAMDPEAMRQAMEALRSMTRVSRAISLILRPGSVTITESGSNVLILNLDAGEEKVVQGGAVFQATAKWLKKGIEIKREIDPGGSVKDVYTINEDGNLVLRREIELMMGGTKGTLVYQRASGEGGA